MPAVCRNWRRCWAFRLPAMMWGFRWGEVGEEGVVGGLLGGVVESGAWNVLVNFPLM